MRLAIAAMRAHTARMRRIASCFTLLLGAACGAQPVDEPAHSAPPAPARIEATAARAVGGPSPRREGRPTLLLPAEPQLRRAAQVMWIGDRYTARVSQGGLSLQITGAKHAGGAAPLLVQRTEYGVDASFGRDGGIYNLTLACEAPADRRCADEAYVRQLAASLTPG